MSVRSLSCALFCFWVFLYPTPDVPPTMMGAPPSKQLKPQHAEYSYEVELGEPQSINCGTFTWSCLTEQWLMMKCALLMSCSTNSLACFSMGQWTCDWTWTRMVFTHRFGHMLIYLACMYTIMFSAAKNFGNINVLRRSFWWKQIHFTE
jgi:hypothetical protein